MSRLPGLQIGRRVHYITRNGVHCAADVLRIIDEEKGIVNLHVLVDLPEEDGPNALPFFRAHNVQFSRFPKVETWHWPERVEPEYPPRSMKKVRLEKIA